MYKKNSETGYSRSLFLPIVVVVVAFFWWEGVVSLRLLRVDNDRYSSELRRCINFFDQSELKLRIVAPE